MSVEISEVQGRVHEFLQKWDNGSVIAWAAGRSLRYEDVAALLAALPYLVPAEPTRLEAEVKAEALREAAEDERLVGLVPGTATWLRERADGLEEKR